MAWYKWRWVGVDRKPIRHYAEHVVPNQPDHGVSTRAEIVPGKSIYMAIKPPWIYYVERSNPASTSMIIIIVRIQTPASSRVYACINAKWWPRGSHLTWMETRNTFVHRFRIGSIAFRVTFLIFFSRKKKRRIANVFSGI